MTHTQNTPAEEAYRKMEKALKAALKRQPWGAIKLCEEALALLPALKPQSRPEPASGNVRVLRDKVLLAARWFYLNGTATPEPSAARKDDFLSMYAILTDALTATDEENRDSRAMSRAAQSPAPVTESATEQPVGIMETEIKEAAEIHFPFLYDSNDRSDYSARTGFIAGAKWAIERLTVRESSTTKEAGKGASRAFYPDVVRAYSKWAETAGDNPFVLADAAFETFLAGWQFGRKYLRQPLTTKARKHLVLDMAIEIERLAFRSEWNWNFSIASTEKMADAALTIAEKALLGKGGQV